jgi:hypothetical protein
MVSKFNRSRAHPSFSATRATNGTAVSQNVITPSAASPCGGAVELA